MRRDGVMRGRREETTNERGEVLRGEDTETEAERDLAATVGVDIYSDHNILVS